MSKTEDKKTITRAYFLRKQVKESVKAVPDDKKMLSVSEFAKQAGISRQYVYSLLDKKLSTYCQRVDNKIMIDSSALSLFTVNGLTVNLTDALDTDCCQLDTDCQGADSMEIDKLNAQISELTAELKKAQQVNTDQTLTIERLTGNCERMRQTSEQDKQKAAAADAERKRADAAEQQCAVKDRQLEAMQKQLDTLTAALTTAQQQAADLTAALTAAQALHAGTIQERLTMQDGEPAKARPADDLTDAEKKTARQDAEPKTGFFKRLFRKNGRKQG